MDEMDMRHALLAELIDKMHGRMADKMFPPDPSLDDQPAVTGINQDGETEDGHDIPAVPSASIAEEKSIDVDKDSEEPTDEEIEEMLK